MATKKKPALKLGELTDALWEQREIKRSLNEQLKIVEKDPNGGRRLTSQGRRDLDRIAAQVANVGQPPKK